MAGSAWWAFDISDWTATCSEEAGTFVAVVWRKLF